MEQESGKFDNEHVLKQAINEVMGVVGKRPKKQGEPWGIDPSRLYGVDNETKARVLLAAHTVALTQLLAEKGLRTVPDDLAEDVRAITEALGDQAQSYMEESLKKFNEQQSGK